MRRYSGHKQEVRLLLPLGDQLISVDAGGDVIVWDVGSGGEEGAGLLLALYLCIFSFLILFFFFFYC